MPRTSAKDFAQGLICASDELDYSLRAASRSSFSTIYCDIAGYAQFMGRNYDEAMRFSHEAIRRRGDFVGAHRVLTAATGMAGRSPSMHCMNFAARNPIFRSPA